MDNINKSNQENIQQMDVNHNSALVPGLTQKTQRIIRKLNVENRGLSKNSKSSNGSKRGELASNRSMSFVSRRAFGDITSNILIDIENMNNSINHNGQAQDPLKTKQLQNQIEETRINYSDPCSNISTQIQTTQQVDKSVSSTTSSIVPSKRTLRVRQRNMLKKQKYQSESSIDFSLAEQKIEECLNEESLLQVPTVNQRLENYHAMIQKFYNPYTHESNMLAVDQACVHDPQSISEYAQANQGSMQIECQDLKKYANPNCLGNQEEINVKMRRILVDWLIDVHMKFKLLPETLFITINLVDRYTELYQIKRKNYQLIGVTCMLIASKYEEIYPPFIKDFIYITDQAYTKDQIVNTEVEILQSLGFELTFPTTLRFLERYSQISECDPKLVALSKYMLELSLVEVRMNRWNQSLLACAAIFVAKKIQYHGVKPWSTYLSEQTKQTEKEVRECAKDLCFILNVAHVKRHYQAAFKKYSLSQYYGVAIICKNLCETKQEEQTMTITPRQSFEGPSHNEYIQQQIERQ